MAVLVAVCASTGCAHISLSPSTLSRVKSPAFISRVIDGAGPKALVFRDDNSYAGKLKKLEPAEADRRLAVKLKKGMSRFELSESLRAKVTAALPGDPPWSSTLDPARVATSLESFLVEEVPANAPDYNLLKPLGADAVVEFVIESYGMRSRRGHAGTFVEGYGRMFFIDGGGDIWRRSFTADQIDSDSPHVDPFKVAKEPTTFRDQMNTLLEGVAAQFAKDLNPSGASSEHRALPSTPAGDTEDRRPGPDSSPRKEPEDLPPPDAL